MTLEQYRLLTPREQQRWIWEEMRRRAQAEIARQAKEQAEKDHG
jgi:hypothetical protein